MMAHPVGTPVTPMHVPIDSASGVPVPPFGFPPPIPPGYFYGPPPAGTMPAATMCPRNAKRSAVEATAGSSHTRSATSRGPAGGGSS